MNRLKWIGLLSLVGLLHGCGGSDDPPAPAPAPAPVAAPSVSVPPPAPAPSAPPAQSAQISDGALTLDEFEAVLASSPHPSSHPILRDVAQRLRAGSRSRSW